MAGRLMPGESRQKPRETRRNLRWLRAWSASLSESFPEPDDGRDTWYWNLPISRLVVDGRHARRSARHTAMGLMLAGAANLRRARHAESKIARVVCTIHMPELFRSSLDVFYSEEAWFGFVERDSPEYTLARLGRNRSLIREASIRGCERLGELGFEETIRDDGLESSGEVWLIGDVDSEFDWSRSS